MDNLRKKLLPYLFALSAMAYTGSLFTGNVLNLYTLLAAVLTAFLFFVYDFINAHRKFGTLIYIAVMAAFIAGVNIIMSTVQNRMEFAEWFLTGGATIDTVWQFMLPLVMMFTLFFSSVTYYFTNVIYRISVLTVISLIPFAIYVKASQNVPTSYPAVMAALNFFLYVTEYSKKIREKRCSAGRAASLVGYIDFAVAAVLIAVIIPKPSEAPYYEKFEAFTNYFSFSGRYGAMSGSYTEHSGNADAYNEMESKDIYLVYTDDPQYFKVQTFDKYDDENRYWVYGSEKAFGYTEWEDDAKAKNFSSLLSAYSISQADVFVNADSDIISQLLANEDKEYTAVIRGEDFPAEYLLAPMRITSAVMTERPDTATRRRNNGEVYLDGDWVGANEAYTVTYYDSDYARDSGWISSGLCDMDMDTYGELLSELTQSYLFTADSEEYLSADAFLNEYYEACDEKYSDFSVSPEIQSISDEITSGLTYDWQKAEAIEQYFYTDGFAYDLGYKAPEESDTPEYFLTESKRGTCSDFATAYCLLAKAAGLTVRYTEGFVCGEMTSAGVYQITTENAHAYPEVFIPGAGWTIYEPTVGSGSTGTSGSDDDDGGTDYLAVFLTSVVVFIGIIIAALIFIFMPKIKEGLFGSYVKAVNAEKGIILIYRRLTGAFGSLYGINASVLTSCEMRALAKEKTGEDIADITLPFEQVCYGGQSISKAERDKAFDLYRRVLLAAKKRIKEEKMTAKRRKRNGNAG